MRAVIDRRDDVLATSADIVVGNIFIRKKVTVARSSLHVRLNQQQPQFDLRFDLFRHLHKNFDTLMGVRTSLVC